MNLMSHPTRPISFLLVSALMGLSGCLLEYEFREPPTNSTVISSNEDGQTGAFEQQDTDSFAGEGGESIENIDTAISTVQDTEENQDSETEPAPCPTGLELGSTLEYLDLIYGIVYLDLIYDSSADNYAYEDFCKDGEIIVGYRGFFRERPHEVVHGKIQALCAKPAIRFQDGKCSIEFGTTSRLPLRGDTGDVHWIRRCPPGEVIVGYQGRTGYNIDQIVFSCAPLILQPEENGYSISTGESAALPITGGNGGYNDHWDECPESHVPTSSIIYASIGNINALGLGCQKLSLLQ